MRYLSIVLLIAAFAVPVTFAQEDIVAAPHSGRYELTLPAGWVTTGQQIRGLEGIFVDEIIVAGDSEEALTSLADIHPEAQRSGKTLIANIFPKGMAVPGQQTDDPEVIFGTILGPSAVKAEFLEIGGFPAARTRDYQGPPYTNAAYAGQTMILDGEFIYFIIYSAPDETGLVELESIAETLIARSIVDEDRPKFATTDGRLQLPVETDWLIAQTGAGSGEGYMILTEPQTLAPFFFGGEFSDTVPAMVVQVDARPYDVLYGSADSLVTDEDRARTLDNAIANAGGVSSGEVQELSIGDAAALRVDLDSAFNSDDNRGVVLMLDAHQFIYTITFVGPADGWEEAHQPVINAFIEGIEVSDNLVPVGTQIGQQAPDFTLSLLDGSTISLSDLHGQVVLLNFWATWCEPCRIEMPEFETAYNTTEGFTILAVNMMEGPEPITDYVDELGLTFPIALDRDGSVTNLYRVVAYPTTYIIDAEGIIRAFNAGPVNVQQVQEWVALASE